MTAIDLAHFKSKLQTIAKNTEHLVSQVSSASEIVELDQNRVGRLSRVDALQSQAMAKASTDRQTILLKAIVNALDRIESGIYGYCHECDEAIALARLEIDPTTLTCIRCAELSEASF